MSTGTQDTTTEDVRARRTAGTIGLAATAILIIGNALHPFDGSTELYGDITQFAAKAQGTVWVIDHLVVTIGLLATPWLLHTWVVHTMPGGVARVWGRLAVVTATIGTTVGALHLTGVDGAALGSFGEVLAGAGADSSVVAAGEVLLRVHLATFLSWVVTYWVVTQLLVAVANWQAGGRPWLTAVLALGGLLAAGSAIVTATEGQLTTLSEPILFRPSTITFTVWLIVASLDLRRDTGTVSAGA